MTTSGTMAAPLKNALACAGVFLVGSFLFLSVALFFSVRVLGGFCAAATYLLPFAGALCKWIFCSVLGGTIVWFLVHTLIFARTSKESPAVDSKGGKPVRTLSAVTPLGLRNPPWIWVLVIAMGSAIIRSFLYYGSIGALYQEVTFPGERHPAIEIRYSGWADQQTHVFVVGPV
jgi:hypothetical protein